MHQYIYVDFETDYYKMMINNENLIVPSVHYNIPLSLRNNNYSYLYKVHMSSKLNTISELPLKCIWRKCILDDNIKRLLSTTDAIRFIFGGFAYDYINMGLFEYLRNIYKNAKLVCMFGDTIDHYRKKNNRFNVEALKSKFDLILTYNEIDAKKYGLVLQRPKTLFFPSSVDNENVKYDLFFVGREKGRLRKLIRVYDACSEAGYNCLFYITGVPTKKKMYREGIIYNQFLGYSDVIEFEKQSRCILNIIQDGAEGITFRDYEAIGLNKFLMTNNPSIFNSPFYTPQLVINTDNLKNEIIKLSRRNNSDGWSGKDEYSPEKWYQWIESYLTL